MTVGTQAIRVINPATEEEVAGYAAHTPEEIEAAIADAAAAQRGWRDAGFDERARVVRAIAAVLRERAEEFARLITTEMGKPLAEAAAEVEKCAWTCDFFADEAEGYLAARRSRRPRSRATSRTSRSASCWRSCRGTSRSSRSSASPPRR